MTIQILDINLNEMGGQTAEILISDGANTYHWYVGGLPVEGDLQGILDGREAELWVAASAAGEQVNDLAERQAATNTYRSEALIFDNMVGMTEAQVRQWIRTNGAEEALVVIWRVLRFVVSWIRAAERWSDVLKRLR